jgi:hypothetical protein
MSSNSVEAVPPTVSDEELARQVAAERVHVSGELAEGSEDEKIARETVRNNQTKLNSVITETLGDFASRHSRSLERVMQLM